MITLTVSNLHWITPGDVPTDLCAHGDVEVIVDGRTAISADNGDWCVSAAALYLLRTLTRSHTHDDPVGDHLLPCCGHGMFAIEGQDDVAICGCPNGIDWQVKHNADQVLLEFDDGTTADITCSEWCQSVCAFSDAVENFYQNSAPKTPGDKTDADGYEAFNREWSRRRREAANVA